MPNLIKVLVCDDHELWRKALVYLLERHGFEVVDRPASVKGFAHCFDEFILPDIAILHYKTSRPDSLQSVVWVREMYPSVKLVISTLYQHRLPDKKFEGLGISGLIIKVDADPHQIIETLKAVADEKK